MTSYQFQFSLKAEKEFGNLPRQLQKHILSKLEYWEKEENPLSFARKLEGTKNRFRFRLGDYRIIVAPQEGKSEILVILIILKIAHRKEVYKFPIQ